MNDNVFDHILKVREAVERNKQVRPEPTRCRHCGTLAAEIVCHICKRDKLIGDEL